MTFHLLEELFTEILVNPVLNCLKGSHTPENENDNPIVFASLIGQAVFSRTRIVTEKLNECFQRCCISLIILLPLHFTGGLYLN